MNFEEMKQGQENLAIEIVSSTFDEFVAPGYSKEGIAEFYKFANAENLAKRSQVNCFTILAQENDTPVGLIEIRDNCHISMFFVKKQFQKCGVGKALLKKSINLVLEKQRYLKELTVNSSPNSLEAYKTLGFKVKNKEHNVNGIRFFPMSLLVDLKIDS